MNPADPGSYIALCTESSFDQITFINDLEVINFKTTDGSTLCKNNVVFKQLGGAEDITNALALSNSVVTNSDKDAFVIVCNVGQILRT